MHDHGIVIHSLVMLGLAIGCCIFVIVAWNMKLPLRKKLLDLAYPVVVIIAYSVQSTFLIHLLSIIVHAMSAGGKLC